MWILTIIHTLQEKKDIIQQVLLQQKNNRGNIYTIASLGCFFVVTVT